MHVLVATPLYPPEIGGPATYTKLMEDGLPQRGIQVTVAKFSEVRQFPRLVRHFAFFIRLVRKAKGVDLMYVQDTFSCGIPAALASLVCRVPLVVRVPGDYAWEQGRQRFGVLASLDEFQHMRCSWQVEVLRWFQRLVVKRARTVVVPSEYFASIVRQWGIESSKVQAIYHGMELPAEIVHPTDTPKRPFMVSTGRLVPWKGFSFLITLLQRLPDWNLVVVGDGPEYERLTRVAGHAGVADRVRFTGSLPRTEALGWCKAADAFVLNTTFESFSFQVLEAMALGVPIITTPIGSIPELITDGREGVLIPPNDADAFMRALESVRVDTESWDKRKRDAKERAAFFSTQRLFSETERMLRDSV